MFASGISAGNLLGFILIRQHKRRSYSLSLKRASFGDMDVPLPVPGSVTMNRWDGSGGRT